MITTATESCSINQSNLLAALCDSQTKKPFENAQIVNCPLKHSF